MAWSPQGARAGTDHDSHLAFLIWACRVRKARPVLLVHECTKTFPFDLLQWWLDDLYDLKEALFEPSDFGHPIRRPGRRYTWGFLASSKPVAL